MSSKDDEGVDEGSEDGGIAASSSSSSSARGFIGGSCLI